MAIYKRGFLAMVSLEKSYLILFLKKYFSQMARYVMSKSKKNSFKSVSMQMLFHFMILGIVFMGGRGLQYPAIASSSRTIEDQDDEGFFKALENVKVALIKISSSGLQTKLHYNIFLGECEDPFSFRVLYVSELKKGMAETRLGRVYQKSKTTELVEEIAHKGLSGSWEDAVTAQALKEKERVEKSQAKSDTTKKKLEDYYRHLEAPSPQPSSSLPSSDSQKSLVRKFSKLRISDSGAKSPPKKVVFNTSIQAREAIEEQYAELPPEGILPRPSSRSLLEDQKRQEKDFKEKREKEARIGSIERRGSLNGSSGSTSPRFNSKKLESESSRELEETASSSTSNQLICEAKRETREGPIVSGAVKEHFDVDQEDINELFEELSTSD